MPYGTGKYTYELVEGWAKYPNDWSLLDIAGLAIDSHNRVYVYNRSTHPLLVFDQEGNLLTSWGEGFFKNPHGICVGSDGSIFCSDTGNHTVKKFTPDGKLLMTLGTKDKPSDTGYVEKFDSFASLATIAKGGPPFNRPSGVALSSSGDIYVTDGYGNARVHKFTSTGTWLLSWGEPGAAPGQFRIPHSIWVDTQDRVWVVDRENSRIQIFNAQGEFLTQWIDFIRPTAMFIDNENLVYVCELAQRVNIYSIEGNLQSQWGTGGLNQDLALFLAPHAIVVDSHGDIYVGEASKTGYGVDKGQKVLQKFVQKT